MKKRILSLFVGLFVSASLMAQATLPTSSDFSGSQLPSVGWETNAYYYTASGNPAPALKIIGTGQYLLISFSGTPGTLTYDITGNSFSGGQFDVQESTDGTTFTSSKSYDDSNMPAGTYTSQSLTLNSATRFVRFFYTNKSAGNVGLDNVNISAGVSQTAELSVLVDNALMNNNGVAYVSSPSNTTTLLPFSIKNSGLNTALNVSNVIITGPGASAFAFNTTPTFPLSIASMQSSDLGLNFTPTASGSYNATVTITSDDAQNPTFTFDVVGYGDGLATEPTAQPTSLTFTNVKSYRIEASFSPSADAEGYLIVRKTGSAITGVPQDGVSYMPGDMVGDAKVVAMTTNTSFVPNYIFANTDYYFAVFAYNGVGQYTNYLTTNPLTGDQTTTGLMIPAGEYDAINTANSTLISDLHGLISPHFQQYYSNYGPRLIVPFYERDTTGGKKALTCHYTGKNYVYDVPFSYASSGFSREHTYAQSWMPYNPVDQEANYYSDYHNLFPVNQNEANSIRSNYPFGVVVSDTLQAIGQAYLGKNAAGQYVYEPRDDQKGTLARALFYMCVRYNGEDGKTWALPSDISSTIPYGQDETVLKQWNLDFPPTNEEMARNDYLDSLQQNRNPFIDHPEYACYIDFKTMTYNADGCSHLNTKNADLNEALNVYPNPATSTVNISVDGTTLVKYTIYDIAGRVVKTADVANLPMTTINVSDLKKGTYLVRVVSAKGETAKPIIVE